jgi:hypothetical protein
MAVDFWPAVRSLFIERGWVADPPPLPGTEEESVQLAEGPVKMQLRGSSSGGTVDLTGYPHLTYAPHQHGPGVRIARNGAAVEAIAYDASPLVMDIDRLANDEGLSWAELFDALLYSRANGMV